MAQHSTQDRAADSFQGQHLEDKVDTIQNRGDYIQSNHITKDEDNNSAIGYRRSLD
jgi:hypothetical protein